jgi:Holliday junction resolvasome RuvABC endonuclease subunit
MSIVLGIDSAFARTGWALVERDGAKERLIAHGILDAVDYEVVSEFAGKMATGALTIDVVVIEDAYLGVNVDTLKALSRLVGRWQQAFEVLGLSTRLVMADVWQRGVLKGLMSTSTAREGRKRAAQIWAKATFAEALGEDEADAVGIATFEIRQRAFARRIGAVEAD